MYGTRLMHCKTDFLSNNLERFVKIQFDVRIGAASDFTKMHSFFIEPPHMHFLLLLRMDAKQAAKHKTNDTHSSQICNVFVNFLPKPLSVKPLSLSVVSSHSLNPFITKF